MNTKMRLFVKERSSLSFSCFGGWGGREPQEE